MLRKFFGKIFSFISPEYGTCERCKMPWNIVDAHSTPYQVSDESADIKFSVEVKCDDPKVKILVDSVSYSCFPLCEHCWTKLKIPKKRLPYYKKMYDSWTYKKGFPFEVIEKAVLNEK